MNTISLEMSESSGVKCVRKALSEKLGGLKY